MSHNPRWMRWAHRRASNVLFPMVIGLGLLVNLPALAQTPACDALSGPKKELAQKILSSQYAHSCCDQTLARCLQMKPRCALVQRLAENICRRVARGQAHKKIVRDLSRRARSMMGLGAPSPIKLDGLPVIGAADAPVQLVVYACATCPFCAKLVPLLYEAVKSGPLRGKVRMYFKTFPLRKHPHSKESGLAFLSAARLDKFWDYCLYSFAHKDDLKPEILADWAQAQGMDKAEFEKLYADPAIREQLIEFKKEGLRNKVEATPALFIDGRLYQGELDMAELVDVFEEAVDRARKVEFLSDKGANPVGP